MPPERVRENPGGGNRDSRHRFEEGKDFKDVSALESTGFKESSVGVQLALDCKRSETTIRVSREVMLGCNVILDSLGSNVKSRVSRECWNAIKEIRCH